MHYTGNMDPEVQNGGVATAERTEEQRRNQRRPQRGRGIASRPYSFEDAIRNERAQFEQNYGKENVWDQMVKDLWIDTQREIKERYARGEGPEEEYVDNTEIVNERIKNVTDAQSLRRVLGTDVATLINLYVEQDSEKNNFLNYISNLSDQVESGAKTLDQAKTGIESLLHDLRNRQTALINLEEALEQRGARINSVEELAQEIAKNDEKWGRGETAILDENGVIVPANLLNWFREQMYLIHDNDPDNQVNFFNDVGLFTAFRHVSLNEMLRYKTRYFSSGKLKDRDGKKVYYEDLATQVLFEAWLFNQARNNDADYRKVSHSEGDVPKIIDQMYLANTFTKLTGDRSTLYRVFTFADQFKAKKKEGEQAAEQMDKKLGTAIRQMLLSYYFISDIDMLQKVLSFNAENHSQPLVGALFRRDTFLKALKENHLDENIVDDFFDQQGNFLGNSNNPELAKKKKREFANFINIYNNPQKDPRIIGLVRGLVKRSAAESNGLIRRKLDENGREEVALDPQMDYGEVWANSLTRWTGVAASNDYDEDEGYTTGHDAAAKTIRFGNYRQKQAETSRGGSYGLWSSMYGIKRLSLDFFTGIHVQDKNGKGERMLLDVLLGRSKQDAKDRDHFNIDLGEEIRPEDMIFEDRTMQQFAGNHYSRSFKMLGQIIDNFGMKFDSFVQMNMLGKREFEPEKAHEVFEGIRKDIRYMFSTWRINWTDTIRTWERVKVGEGQYEIQFKEVPMYKAFFGEEITKGMTPEKELRKQFNSEVGGDEKQWKEYYEKKVVSRLHKNFFMYLIANEMYAHKNYSKTGYKHYDFATFEAIYNFLEKWPGEVDTDDPDHLKSTYVKKPYFSKEEIKKIRKASGTTQGALFRKEFGKELGAGSIIGMKKAISEWFEAVFEGL